MRGAVDNVTVTVTVVVTVMVTVAIYVRWSLRPCVGTQILQTDVARCTPDLLAEKKPIVLQDRVVDHRALLTTVFRYQFVASDTCKPPSGKRTNARFTVLFNPRSDCEIDIGHPHHHESRVTRVRLPKNMTLIMPPRWFVSAPSDVGTIRLYDTYHTIAKYFIK